MSDQHWDSDSIAALVRDFDEANVSKSRWTHQAHLVMAQDYLARYGDVEAALTAMRPRIKALNLSLGGENTANAGYHDSVTKFMLIATEHVLKGSGDAKTPTARVAATINSELISAKFPLYFYSFNLLADPKCRAGWVEPDLRPTRDLSRIIGVHFRI